MTQTRLRRCILNHDLNKLNIVVSDKCSCGDDEDAYPFFKRLAYTLCQIATYGTKYRVRHKTTRTVLEF